MVWCSALTFVSEGPVSPFFLFFLFVLLSAAYRWGFRETAGSAILIVLIVLGETVLVTAGPWRPAWSSIIEFDLNGTILRVTYLLLTGFLLGYLAEQEKQFRAETAAITDVGRQPQVDIGLSGSVLAVASTLRQMFTADVVAIVLRDEDSKRARVWRSASATEPAPGPAEELSPEDEAAWLFGSPGTAWEAGAHGQQDATIARVADAAAWALRNVSIELPTPVRLAGALPLMGADFELPGEWRGRIYVYGPRGRFQRRRRVHLLAAMAPRIAQTLSTVLLMQRLRSEVSAAERARVARELHDGAIQALIGLQMTVEAMRRSPQDPAAVNRDLAGIQELLQREVVSLRQLMQALRPVEHDTGETLDEVLAGLTERFRRDSGVPARFMATGGRVRLEPAAAVEVVRIAQEALMNVRKHSGASNVLVHVTRLDDGCRLLIEDDGRGFAFAGRLSADELDRQRLGPAIIKERARIVAAALEIESRPGRGATIVLTVRDHAVA
jgi:signal transduction histidine kinase